MKLKKLNILLICKTLPWQFKGGIQTHTWELAKALNEKGHNVSILSGGSFRSFEAETKKEGISIINIPYFPGRYIKPISFLAEEFSFNFAVKKWVKENENSFDIIHAQGRSGYLLFLIKGIHHKLVNTVHGLIDLENKHKQWFDFNCQLHTCLTKEFEKRLLASSSLNISVSNALRAQIHKLRSKRSLSVISNGVNIPHDKSNLDYSKPTRFLFIGRLHPVKGICAIVKQMQYASPKLSLDIIGMGPEFDNVKNLINQYGLHQRVRLLGEYSNEKIHQVLSKYQALILPSQYETQGIVLLEANSHSIPVIASDIPAIRESVEHHHNGILCNPDKPQEFIEAMQYMVDNPWETVQMGRNGKSKVLRQFTWDKIANETIQAYYKIAQ